MIPFLQGFVENIRHFRITGLIDLNFSGWRTIAGERADSRTAKNMPAALQEGVRDILRSEHLDAMGKRRGLEKLPYNPESIAATSDSVRLTFVKSREGFYSRLYSK